MLSSSWCLCLLALCASAKALEEVSDETVRSLVDKLDGALEQDLLGLQSLIQDAAKKLPEYHEEEAQKSLERIRRSTGDIMELARGKRCSYEVTQLIAGAAYDPDDRWHKCMNFTQKFVDFEEIAFNLYKDLLVWKPEICGTVNDIMVCYDKSIFNQVYCFTELVSNQKAQYKQLTDELVKVVHDVNALFKKTVDDFIGCFGSGESNVKRNQIKLIQEKC